MQKVEINTREVYEPKEKRFAASAERLTRQEYFEAVAEIEKIIGTRFGDAMSIIPLDDKENFGDIDMVIIWDLPQEESGGEYLRSIFGERVVEHRHLKNDKIDSLLLRLGCGKVAQVDFARTKDELEFQAKMIHASKGHSSAVIGTLAMAYGYKFAQDGFYKRHFDSKGQYHDILVTQDLLLAMEMLGLDPSKWIEAKQVEDIVELITSSKFFDNRYFDRSTMKHKRRVSIEKRSVQDYLYTHIGICKSAELTQSHQEYFRERFADYQQQIEKQVALLEENGEGSRIDGNLIMKVFGLRPSKLVGEILVFIKNKYPEHLELDEKIINDVAWKFFEQSEEVTSGSHRNQV